jgi:hypothetical protein
LRRSRIHAWVRVYARVRIYTRGTTRVILGIYVFHFITNLRFYSFILCLIHINSYK